MANIHAAEKDYNSAVSFLGAGDDFANMAGAYYARMFFLLSKAMLYLLERKFAEANPILHQTGPLIETWVQQNSHQKETVAKQQKEYLQMFFLVLQVRCKTHSNRDRIESNLIVPGIHGRHKNALIKSFKKGPYLMSVG